MSPSPCVIPQRQPVQVPTILISGMATYVYALHDFSPEHEDELTFRAGDKIEVVEKDEIYGDGWWQVSAMVTLN